MAQALEEVGRGLSLAGRRGAACLALVAAGCLAYPSVHGPEGVDTIDLDPAFLGVWYEVGEERSSYLEVDPRNARAVWEGEEGAHVTTFEVRAFELEQSLLLELSLAESEREAVAERYGAFLLPLRVFVRVTGDGERAQLAVPEPDWVHAGDDLTEVRLSGGDTARVWTLEGAGVERRLRAAVREAPWRTVLELERRP